MAMADPTKDLINALIGPRPAGQEKTWKTYDPFGTEYEAQQIPPPAIDPLDLLAMRFGLGRGGLANSAMAKGPWTKEAAPVGRPTQQQAFQGLDKLDTDLAHIAGAKNVLSGGGKYEDALKALSARQRSDFRSSLPLHLRFMDHPAGLPLAVGLGSPAAGILSYLGMGAAYDAFAPQSWKNFDSEIKYGLRKGVLGGMKGPDGLPVLPDAPY